MTFLLCPKFFFVKKIKWIYIYFKLFQMLRKSVYVWNLCSNRSILYVTALWELYTILKDNFETNSYKSSMTKEYDNYKKIRNFFILFWWYLHGKIKKTNYEMIIISLSHQSTHSPAVLHYDPTRAAGFETTKITESPRRNILLTNRSLFITCPLCLPFPPLEVSVHISFTSSNNLG